MNKHTKLFRDPVHGNIEIPVDYCHKFIDTALFQRLRFVEQSSMRMLFPSARHDRFVHSLGVYSIARRVFSSLETKIRESFQGNDNQITRFKETFLSAALLHDCAHSPFSHTGESVAKHYCGSEIEQKLIATIGSESFRNDFYGNNKSNYATHELASAYVACKVFGTEFDEYNIDKEQFARMITGIRNKDTHTTESKTYNCLISLINGFVVDVDRLDYLQRDTWATGICNASVDLESLIGGIDVDLNSGEIRIKHTALPSIVNAISARDYIYQWILPNHIVVYANLIMERAIHNLISSMASEEMSAAKVGEMLFSPDRLLQDGQVNINGETIHMPTDGDLLYLMKKYIPCDENFLAYSIRQQKHISLWKTHAEFVNLFMSILHDKQLNSFKEASLWEVYHAKLHEFAKSHPYCLCSEPRPVKTIRHEMCSLNANIEDSYAHKILQSDKLDLNYLFGSIQQDADFHFNAFITASAIRDNAVKAENVIKDLQQLLVDTIDEYDSLKDPHILS